MARQLDADECRRIAERVARERGGEPLEEGVTVPPDKWATRLTWPGQDAYLGGFTFPAYDEAFRPALLEALDRAASENPRDETRPTPERVGSDITSLVELLEAEEFEIRRAAIDRLVVSGSPAVPRLERACTGPNPTGRAAAREALDRIRGTF